MKTWLKFCGLAGVLASPIWAARPDAALPSHIHLLARTAPAGSFVIRSGLSGVRCRVEETRLRLEDVRFELETLDSGLGFRDRIMKDHYFETARFPYAYLRQVRAERGRFDAELVIRDHAVPVHGTYAAAGRGLEARFRTRLSAFGIPEPRYFGIGVKDEIEVVVTSEECAGL